MLSTQPDKSNVLFDIFQSYQIPENINQDSIDPVDGHLHRFQQRYLGTCHLAFDKTASVHKVTFYEISESEILEVHTLSPQLLEETTEILPPKKRNRRRLIKYDVVFTLDTVEEVVSSKYRYFTLSRDMMTDILQDNDPYKMMLSFYPNNNSCQQQCGCHGNGDEYHSSTANMIFKTKLEEFAAVCSTSCKLTTTNNHVLLYNIVLTNVSHDLYRAIKQLVSPYESLCQNMMKLMKYHGDRVHHYKETTVEEEEEVEEQVNDVMEQDNFKQEEVVIEEEVIEDNTEEAEEVVVKHKKTPLPTIPQTTAIKICLYCNSKSTPMWRRGPQGAGTLCNACGVKWKHGKILNGNDHEVIIPTNRRNSNHKYEKKRKNSNASKKTTKKTKTNNYYESFAVPAMPPPSASSSTSDQSPIESPNTSPSITTLIEQQQDIKNSLLAYDTDTLSVYVGEDAVEAAAVLTLLKRS